MNHSFLTTGPFEFGLLMRIAMALLCASLTGECLRHFVRLPRVSGYALAGLVLGPLGLGWLNSEDLPYFRVLIDLALALLLFELGIHVHLRWLRDNPWVIASSLIESTLTFGAVFATLYLTGSDARLASSIAAIAIGTSPAVIMRVVAEIHAQGQVTQKLFVLCALNMTYSVIVSKLIIGELHGVFKGDWLIAVIHPLYLLLGSVGVGASLALAFKLLRGLFDLSDEQGVPVLFGLLLLTVSALEILALPVVLAPLLGGMLVKYLDPRPHLWPRNFGTAGAILGTMLFVLTGVSLTWNGVAVGGLSALTLLAVRLVAKSAGVMLLGPVNGLSVKQALALGLALSPMSAVAFLLTEDIRTLFPVFGMQVGSIVLSMMVILELVGPIAVQWSLRYIGETRKVRI
ncbi:MAG: cation:proton antiporter [Betaproteobacteria bacterium]|nr:cation:proton antiporter [Betaproteobacteria bacterium]